ncbi:MAG: DUF465 domain-containing protein [Desulfohalobiaceae bacterium]
MEQYEMELVEKYAEKDDVLKILWEEHVLFEKQLERLEGKPFLTPQEERLAKEIKKKKLAGKTKIQHILDKYRKLEV